MAKSESKNGATAAPTSKLSTEQRLAALEAKLAELEARLNRVSA